jgi:methionine synthase II (cobalamin-independent)
MKAKFTPLCQPLLIGSIPLDDHQKAFDLVMAHTPRIPLWVQLPAFKEEGMVPQFLPGMPGLTTRGGKDLVDIAAENFDGELLAFYEEYMAVTEGIEAIEASRFRLSGRRARGFNLLLERIQGIAEPPMALKGQITGPITFCTGVHDQNDRAIFYNESVRDAAVKLLALKAAWQTRKLRETGLPAIVFIDEPALAGFGSSEFISISKEDITDCLEEVIAAIHDEGGLAGIHVCANTDWSIILDSKVDIVNFDAYAYFDRFILYPDQIKAFLTRGGLIAWGIVPTLKPEEIQKESVASLYSSWETKSARLVDLGIDPQSLKAQSFITPSCGTGSLTIELATRVLQLTRDLSARIRKEANP